MVLLMKILVTEPLHEAGVTYLQQEFDVDIKMGLSPSALLEEVGQYDAIITRSGTPVTAAPVALSGGMRPAVCGSCRITTSSRRITAANSAALRSMIAR